jgi:hypothetical protein
MQTASAVCAVSAVLWDSNTAVVTEFVSRLLTVAVASVASIDRSTDAQLSQLCSSWLHTVCTMDSKTPLLRLHSTLIFNCSSQCTLII